MKTDYASVVLKVLGPFLSHWFNELMAEFTLYGQVGLVGHTPNVPSGLQVSPEGSLTGFGGSIQACQTQVRFCAPLH